ncbi:probable peptidyl-glycine alpha-amidating monooxygenase [Coccomyxa sp. Obi]|nr:probable peptidyl-glycine alpha-amidating monooxygenase [Coccomyxa sp. Obi]
MLLFGCAKPASSEKVWDCHTHSVCAEAGSHVLYGWAKNAEAMHLPPGVGFRVGQGTGTRHLVLQVHYTHMRPPGDKSGMRLKLTDAPLPFSAGMMMYASYFQIPPKKSSHLVPTKCCYAGFEPAYGFAYRVHTHALGRSVYMDRIEKDGSHSRVCEHSPQLPQGFTPVSNITFLPGQVLEATCDFDSTERTEVTHAGSTHHAEMCNLYMMMWSELPVFMTCSGQGTWGDTPSVDMHGPGGLPKVGRLVEEAPQYWKPPLPYAPEHTSGLGQVAGVAKGLAGTVWVLHRGGRIWDATSFEGANYDRITYKEPISDAVVVQKDQDTGEVLASFGAGEFYMPHMITVDTSGNVWTTDVGKQVATKWSPTGKKLMELGTPMEPGNDKTHFCKPTQVAVALDGTLYVGDGYCNSRVVEFSAEGEWRGEFVAPGEALRNPHSVVLQECSRALWVAEREAARVHRFSLDSRSLEGTWDLAEYGPVYALAVGPYGAVLALSWNRDKEGQPTHVVWLDENQAGKVAAAWAVPDVQAPHDMAVIAAPVRLAGKERPIALLIGETRPSGSRLQKYIVLPEGEELPVDAAAAQPVSARQQWQEVLAAAQGETTTTTRVTLLGEVRRLGSGASDGIGSAFSQVLLVGLPLTVLVSVAAVALWSLSGPPVPLPELKHVSKAHMSPQQQRFA